MQEQHFLDGFHELSAGFGVKHTGATSTVAITDFVIFSHVKLTSDPSHAPYTARERERQSIEHTRINESWLRVCATQDKNLADALITYFHKAIRNCSCICRHSLITARSHQVRLESVSHYPPAVLITSSRTRCCLLHSNAVYFVQLLNGIDCIRSVCVFIKY